MTELSGIGAARPVESHATPGQPKAAVNQDDRAKLQNAAREFEALFLNQMLKEMRATIGESSLGGQGLGQTTYTEMFDQEVARSLSQKGALGIAAMLLSKLAQHDADAGLEPAGNARGTEKAGNL